MKVLLLTIDFFSKGGIQRYSRYQYKALVDLYGKENIFVFSLSPKSLDNCFEENIEVVYTGGGTSLKNKIFYIFKVIDFIKKENINIVINTHVKLSFISYISKYFYKIKYFTNVYGLEIWSGLTFIDKFGLLKSDKLIGDCNFILQYIEKHFKYDNNKLNLLYDPVDINVFKKKSKNLSLIEKYNIPTDKFIIGTIGRLERNKGHEVIIKSLNKLDKNVIYVIVGGGFMINSFRKLVDDLKLNDRVFFTDRVSDNELIEFYNIMDLIALLSVLDNGEGEGLPLGLIEASSCKIPILAGNEDGSYEAISDKYPNGFRVNPRNIDEIVEKIQFYIDNPEVRKEHAESGRKFVIEEFEYNKFKWKLKKILNEH